ncbi:hypothetical protein B0A52_00321 [Exophiala mesophila]|uniref:Secreted protein n=1 Tax=Exophiala mesophila TaxID=212818 RepID=A0A438NJP8_EXOME|nr:hypothetical protein B0A52_00321 [Exophiala mesophila]
MVAISALVSAFLTVAAVQATSVTKLLVDIATAGQGAASCLSRVSFDDAPDVDVLGCILDSNGRSVNTALGQVTMAKNVPAGLEFPTTFVKVFDNVNFSGTSKEYTNVALGHSDICMTFVAPVLPWTISAPISQIFGI